MSQRLGLLEGFLSRTELADCVRYALRWLDRSAGIHQSICLVRRSRDAALVVGGSHGLPLSTTDAFAVSLDDWADPLVAALTRCRLAHYPAPRSNADRRRRPFTPFEDAPFDVRPLVSDESDDVRNAACGLLLFASPSRGTLDLAWFTSVIGQTIDRILRQRELVESSRGEGRERALLHNIVNAVTDPIVLTDTEGRLLIANTRALSLFTASEGASEGRRAAVRMNNMLFSSALASKAIDEIGAARRELLLVNPLDGSDLLFELLSTVIDDPRDGTGIVSILRNVSDLRRASEEIEENYRRLCVAEADARAERDRLNLIIESVADPIVVTDAAGRISLMNDVAERLFTAQAGSSATGQRTVQANDAHFSTFIAGMLVDAGEQRTGELNLTDPRTGEAMPVEAIGGKVLSEYGEITAIVTILHDRRKTIETAQLYERLKEASSELERKVQAATADIAHQNELLRRQAIELEQASALKSQFLANMSHEFRTPLNAMLGYTSMLQQEMAGPLPSPTKRQLSRIASNGRHLLALINEILDISRIEAGRMPLQISRFEIAELVNEVRAELDPIILHSKLTFALDLPGDLPSVSSDRQKVKQIVLNLVSNALKFTHQGGVTIRVQHHPREQQIDLQVVDTGIGIGAEDQDRIFEDFRQLDNSPTRPYGGTGLGLSICRRLAHMLDARLTVQSEPGKGSTFTLTLCTQGPK